jgi:hypothetical protein
LERAVSPAAQRARVVLELAEYGSADARSVAAGVHEVQLMMGGELSNKLLLVIPRTTSFSVRP